VVEIRQRSSVGDVVHCAREARVEDTEEIEDQLGWRDCMDDITFLSNNAGELRVISLR
jgi:hypothetical protein